MKAARFPILLSTIMAAACAGKGAAPVVHPAKVHKLDSGKGAFVTTYDSRGRGAYIVVNSDGALKNSAEAKSILLCAEPPPDASGNTNYADALKTSVEASAAYELIKAAVNVGVDRDVTASSNIIDVAARSELVMLMRDALYRLCEFHLNGTMTPEQVSENYTQLLVMAKQMGQRDNVASLVRALEVSLANGADPAVIQGILVTIQALSFIEAASATESSAMKSILSTAATRTLLKADEVQAFVKELEKTYIEDLNEKKARAKELRDALSQKKPKGDALKKAEQEVTEAEQAVDAAKKALEDFRKENGLSSD